MVKTEICTNGVPGEALRRVNSHPSQHDPVVVLHGLHTNRTFPVTNSCIIPYLIRRALDSLAPSASISTSISERTSATADCSSTFGGRAIGSSLTSFSV